MVLPVGPWRATVADNVCLKGGSAFLLYLFIYFMVLFLKPASIAASPVSEALARRSGLDH